mmetsp:Transcript_9762/g.20667  ORF Transcript_9762/g.20667 Transcript_9762/m.20667 type:complete len:237 (+) Transcript_9762:283-993(+)
MKQAPSTAAKPSMVPLPAAAKLSSWVRTLRDGPPPQGQWSPQCQCWSPGAPPLGSCTSTTPATKRSNAPHCVRLTALPSMVTLSTAVVRILSWYVTCWTPALSRSKLKNNKLFMMVYAIAGTLNFKVSLKLPMHWWYKMYAALLKLPCSCVNSRMLIIVLSSSENRTTELFKYCLLPLRANLIVKTCQVVWKVSATSETHFMGIPQSLGTSSTWSLGESTSTEPSSAPPGEVGPCG